jgi:hypothetical protein
LSSEPRTRATAKIEVHTYEPETYEDSGGRTDLVEIHVTEAFHGDIEGQGVVRFLQAVHADGSARFVIPGSGTGGLAGLRGEGGFTANLGEGADITLDYWFE